MGSAISRALASVQTGPLEWTIAAHKEIEGHLARIMREVPLQVPPFEKFATAIRMAFERSVKVGELGNAMQSRTGRLGRAAKFGAPGSGRPQRFGKLGIAGARDVFKGFGSVGWAMRERIRVRQVGRALRQTRPRGGAR
jgi:hypothetical protein